MIFIRNEWLGREVPIVHELAQGRALAVISGPNTFIGIHNFGLSTQEKKEIKGLIRDTVAKEAEQSTTNMGMMLVMGDWNFTTKEDRQETIDDEGQIICG